MENGKPNPATSEVKIVNGSRFVKTAAFVLETHEEAVAYPHIRVTADFVVDRGEILRVDKRRVETALAAAVKDSVAYFAGEVSK